MEKAKVPWKKRAHKYYDCWRMKISFLMLFFLSYFRAWSFSLRAGLIYFMFRSWNAFLCTLNFFVQQVCQLEHRNSECKRQNILSSSAQFEHKQSKSKRERELWSVFVIFGKRLLFVDTHDARGRGEEHPTKLDVRSWPVPNHVLDVVIETICTCNKTYKTFLLMCTRSLEITCESFSMSPLSHSP